MSSIHDYDDIIGMPRPEPKRHTRMPIPARAAQFMPFAALTGYAAVIEEITRQTEEKPFLDENEKQLIDRELRSLKSHPDPLEKVSITYFLPDRKKEGGSIRTLTAAVGKVDEFAGRLLLTDGREIPFDDILAIERIEKSREDF